MPPPPYVGSDGNLLILQAEITDLQQRVAALDGTGLSNPALAWITVDAKKIAGLQTSLSQSVLLLQQMISTLQLKVADLAAQVSHL